jgi:methylenetetrahydrofolate dehydrogenase (NADP+) / methenyltetrahydrofolate cyclohydrolase
MDETADPRLMSGVKLAEEIVARSAERADVFVRETGSRPCLAAVLVGDDPASATYVRMKRERCERAGIESRFLPSRATIDTEELVATIVGLSADPSVHGILLQHPVPPGIDERAAFEAISPAKDVDGVTMHSFAAMAFGLPGFASCTPGGIVRLLDEWGVDPAGKHAVVIGRSPILASRSGRCCWRATRP